MIYQEHSLVTLDGPERNFNFYGFSEVNRQLDQSYNVDGFVVEPTDSLTTTIVGAAKAIFAESDEKIFTSSDIKNANSILNKLLNTLKSINYNDLDNYNHFHDTSTKKSNQLLSHIYNIMIEKRYDLLISQLYEKSLSMNVIITISFSFNRLLA